MISCKVVAGAQKVKVPLKVEPKITLLRYQSGQLDGRAAFGTVPYANARLECDGVAQEINLCFLRDAYMDLMQIKAGCSEELHQDHQGSDTL